MAKYGFLDHPEIRDWDCPAIYGLFNTEGKIIYVGKTTDPLRRFFMHRARFGRGLLMKLIQTEFDTESMARAEVKWIRILLKHGCPLTNTTYTDDIREQGCVADNKRRPGKTASKPTDTGI